MRSIKKIISGIMAISLISATAQFSMLGISAYNEGQIRVDSDNGDYNDVMPKEYTEKDYKRDKAFEEFMNERSKIPTIPYYLNAIKNLDLYLNILSCNESNYIKGSKIYNKFKNNINEFVLIKDDNVFTDKVDEIKNYLSNSDDYFFVVSCVAGINKNVIGDVNFEISLDDEVLYSGLGKIKDNYDVFCNGENVKSLDKMFNLKYKSMTPKDVISVEDFQHINEADTNFSIYKKEYGEDLINGEAQIRIILPADKFLNENVNIRVCYSNKNKKQENEVDNVYRDYTLNVSKNPNWTLSEKPEQ